MKKICLVQDCEEQRIGKKDYCRQHYMRYWRYGDPTAGKFRKKILTTGKRNYISEDDECSIKECDNKVLPDGCKGMCRTHYGKSYRWNDPYYEAERVDWSVICMVDDCTNTIHSTLGYCVNHYRKVKLYGDANYVRPPGRTSHPLYITWSGMRARCNIESCTSYPLYGGRGIYVCERWDNLEDGFENFIEDMGEKPSGTSIDRIDNDGPYSPENCRWATATEQNNNRKNNFILEHDGVKRTAAEWGRISGVDPSVIRGRLKMGWSVPEAIFTPIHTKGQPKQRQNALDKSIVLV